MKTAVGYLKLIGTIVAIVVGSLTVAGALVKGVMYWGSRASASEMASLHGEVNIVKVKMANDEDWRRAMWDQVQAIAKRVGAPAVPPPVIVPPPDAGKSDAPR